MTATRLPDFTGTRVLVVGDVMLDRYWFGDVSRISPEAPVPVVLVRRTEERHIDDGDARVAFADSAMEAARGADALVIMTEWKAFRSPDFAELKRILKSPVIIDGRNLYEPAVVRSHGLEYHAIGRDPR